MSKNETFLHLKESPFCIIPYGYEVPDTFCDRQAELEKLKKAVENGRNVTLLAERRIGKTGPIKHFFNSIVADSKIKCIYMDIFATSNLSEFTVKFAEAIIGSMDSQFDKASKVLGRKFRSILFPVDLCFRLASICERQRRH